MGWPRKVSLLFSRVTGPMGFPNVVGSSLNVLGQNPWANIWVFFWAPSKFPALWKGNSPFT